MLFASLNDNDEDCVALSDAELQQLFEQYGVARDYVISNLSIRYAEAGVK